jgi:hypothetical protein
MATLLTRNETEGDKEWTSTAVKNRNEIKIYLCIRNSVFIKSFKGSNTNMEMIKHDQTYKNYLMKACNDLNLDYPDEKDFSFKRDYYLIRDADSIYFSGYFDITGKSRLQIKGREGWIVEMFVNKIIESRKHEEQKAIQDKLKPKVQIPLVPVYMFSEDLKCWCQLNCRTSKWIYIMRPPKPNADSKYLGFGSDPISVTARIEIGMI